MTQGIAGALSKRQRAPFLVKNTDFMYVLCAAEWSFRAISYCFVHRRTSRFGSRFGSNSPAVHLAYSYTQFHIVKILIHCDFPGKHPAAPLFAVVRYMKPLHVQRPSAVLADCSINNRIILPLFHTAFEVSIPQTTDNDKSRRGAQDLRRYKQRKRAFPMCCDDFPHTEGSHLT